MQDLKIALIQSNLFWEDKSKNLHHFEYQFLNKLTKGDCDIVILPEMFNTGFTMQSELFSETLDGPTVEWMKKWSLILDAQMIGSIIIKDNYTFYNRLLVVNNGHIEATYDKRHLFRMANENNHFSSGNSRVIHSVKGWRILLQICYDLRFPVFSRNTFANDKPEYDLSIYVANWPEKRAEVWRTLLKARAIENQSFSIGVNRIGEDGNGISHSGESTVTDPWGNCLHQSKPHHEELKLLTLTSESLVQIREIFPAYLDADEFKLQLKQE